MPRPVAFAILLTSATAVAGGRAQQARALYGQGKDLAAHHDYLEAADRFIAAYNLTPKAEYLLEIARTYREANACAKSAHYYRAYLSVRHLSISGAIGRELAVMDACAKTQPVEPATTVEPAPAAPEPAPTPTPTLAASAAPAAPPPPEPSHAHGHPGTIAITVVGMALLGGAAAFGFDAHAAQIDRENLCPAPCTWSPSLNDQATSLDARGNLDTIVGVVGLAAGVLAIGGGVALYFAQRNADQTVVVAPAPGGASVLVKF